jgi:hypothetical protein
LLPFITDRFATSQIAVTTGALSCTCQRDGLDARSCSFRYFYKIGSEADPPVSSDLGDILVPASRRSSIIFLFLRPRKESLWMMGMMMLQTSYPPPRSTTQKPLVLTIWLSLATLGEKSGYTAGRKYKGAC